MTLEASYDASTYGHTVRCPDCLRQWNHGIDLPHGRECPECLGFAGIVYETKTGTYDQIGLFQAPPGLLRVHGFWMEILT